MLPSRAVCWRCSSQLRAQARPPVAQLAFSSLADSTPNLHSNRADRASRPERRVPRHQDGAHKSRHAGRSRSNTGASAYDMFNQIVNANNTDWTGKPAIAIVNNDLSKTKPVSEIDITFLLSTLVARRNEPVRDRLETFTQSIWPHLQAYGTNLPAPISQLITAFVDGACKDEIQYGRASSCAELARLAASLGITNPHIPNVMALRICHAFATGKNSTSHRNFLSQNLLDLWMHVSQMHRLPERGKPLRFALPDEIEFKVALRNPQTPAKETPSDGAATVESFLQALFPQFDNGLSKELVDGLLATLCVLSDPRYITERVQREAAPLLKLASIFFGEYPQVAELMLQQFPRQVVPGALSFPAEKSHELEPYIRNQWTSLIAFLSSEASTWRRDSSGDKFRASLTGIHRRLRKAYQERNKPGVQTIWADFHQKQSDNADLRWAIKSRPELMDFFVFVACALRLDYEYKTALEMMMNLQIPLTLKTYTSMMHGWRLCKDTRKIDALWTQLEGANVHLDVPIWTERLAAYILKGKVGACMAALTKLQKQWEDAIRTNTVEESGAVKPSIEMINACIKGILEIEPPAAKVLLSWAHKNDIKPDVSTHNIILRKAFAAGPDDVAWLMDVMAENGVEPNQATFVILIEEMLSLTGSDAPETQVEAVNQVFADLARSNVALNAELYAKALHAVASLANASDAAVDAVLAHLQHQNVRINPYMVTILIERSLQQQPREFAPIHALLEKHGMQDISRGDQTLWERVIRAAALTGQPGLALDLFDQLEAADRPVTSLPCLNELLRALAVEEDLVSARRVVDSVLRNKLVAQTQSGAHGDVHDARFWKHHFWYVAKENNLLDEANMPGGLQKLIANY
ncbi:hypothetical protein PWT90_05012 [Aphanocladium album]|nr:hypothetical protein PWT90_05012 [Aphanocladium album]